MTHTCCRNHLCSTRSQTRNHCKRHNKREELVLKYKHMETKIKQQNHQNLEEVSRQTEQITAKLFWFRLTGFWEKPKAHWQVRQKACEAMCKNQKKAKREKGWRGLKTSQNEAEIHRLRVGEAEMLTCRQLTAAAWSPLWVCKASARPPCLCLEKKNPNNNNDTRSISISHLCGIICETREAHGNKTTFCCKKTEAR